MQGESGKVWLITGASAGFGKSLTEEILARGGSVVACARSRESVAAWEQAAPRRALAVAMDVTRPEEIRAGVAAAMARFGRIDVLVNNAGYGFLSGLEEGSDAEARAQFDVNFFGLADVTREVLPVMRAQGGGCVVNITSTAGVYGFAGSAYYSASKFAVEGLSEALAREVAPFGVGVLIVEPGPFRTEFFGRSMRAPARPIAEYANTAEVRSGAAHGDGQQPGDPARAAKAIADTVWRTPRPLRLVLGAGAFERVCAALQARIEDVRVSRDVSVNVDFPAA